MQKLIIGCGYLGRRVAAAWLDAGHEVTALTRSQTNAAELSRLGITPVLGDVCDSQSLAALPPAQSVLIAVGFDRTAGRSQHEVYVEGLRHVLNQVVGRCERLIYISSSSVYGQSAGEWVNESSPCEPVQSGGQCCLAAEELIRAALPSLDAANRARLSANVLRLSGIYGPGRLLSRVESLRAGEPLSGRGDAWLNLIHVDDAASAVLACEERGQPGATYLITDDRPIRRDEYYGQLASLIAAPQPTFLDGQPAQRGSGGLNKRCSNEQARAELGLTLRYSSITAGLPHALNLLADEPLFELAPSAVAAWDHAARPHSPTPLAE